ncbi:MAG TPA: FAD-dependent oxidoreductase, partial [Kineosporiaceae bacterium]
RVVVVGGGFIGTEVAWTLHALGRDVAIVEPLPTLMVRGLGARIGAAITRRHAAAGIDLRLGAGVAGVDGGDQVEAVQLTDGTRLPADLVVLGLGTAPETEWLAGSGLDLRDGVVCDERLRARGAEQVYAVGDVARWWHPRYGENIRVEHWSNAIDTAAVAAANITGTRTVHDALPYVWSEQLDGRLQIFGRVQTGDDVRVVHGDLEGDFVAVTGSASRPGAAVGIGAVRPLVRVRKLLAAGAGWEEVLAGG